MCLCIERDDELIFQFNSKKYWRLNLTGITWTCLKATKWILKQFKDVISSRDDIEIETVKEPKTKQKSILVTIKGI